MINSGVSTKVSTIGTSAFDGCSSLSVLTIGNGVTNIAAGAFDGCESITTLVIPDTVKTIGPNAFNNCTGLTDIVIGIKVSKIDPTAFAGATNIKTVFTNNTKQTVLNAFSSNENVTLNNLIGGPLICFKQDSKILTDKGYVEIQDLRNGDLVKTLNDGFKPIFMIGKRIIHHPASNDRIQNQLYKCSQENYPEIFEPLIITGCHSILVDDFVNEDQREKTVEILGKIYETDKKYRLPACADPRTSVYETEGSYTIYHLALENEKDNYNYGIYANGLLVETCSKRYLKELSNMFIIE